jgi:Spo0E like sporulation regulatory protein.
MNTNGVNTLSEIEEKIDIMKGYLDYLIDHKGSKDRILEVSMDLDDLLNEYYESKDEDI